MRPPVALTIAGSDSGGGAGIQADLKTFEAFGVWGTSALTGITAQNTLGVREAMVLPAALVGAQIEAVRADFEPRATKTGMLGSAEVIRVVADAVRAGGLGPLVVDPVLITSHGDHLLEPSALRVLAEELMPVASVVTPNIPEAEALLGRRITNPEDMVEAATSLAERGPATVIVKGGHIGGERSPDVVWHAGRVYWLDGPRLASPHTHGTGCTLSAALCAELARGGEVLGAAAAAKRFVTEAIRFGLGVGHGIGPVNPGWRRGQGQADLGSEPTTTSG